MCTLKAVQLQLDAILSYLQPHWNFVNCHMVNFLTDQHWRTFVPEELRAELKNTEDVRFCIESEFWRNEEVGKEFPAFAEFLKANTKLSLVGCPELVHTVEQLEEQLKKTRPLQSQLSIKEFMSAKKCHEVEITAALVNQLIEYAVPTELQSKTYIVDAGDGKGYLSSRLALQYGCRVLGIDANAANTENALERNRKLQRAWMGLTARAELQSKGIVPKRRSCNLSQKSTLEPNQGNYKTTSKFITTDINFREMICEEFSVSESPIVCLTGLHTCGNLAATCLQVFNAEPNCKILCNIGCCYHLLKEQFSHNEFFGNKALMGMQSNFGFPLSQYLQSRQICLGRNARMLAAQSLDRTLASKELPNISLYYRALLEVLIERHAPQSKNDLQVGKVRKYDNFFEYVRLCSEKLDVPWLGLLQGEELQALLHEFTIDKHYLDLFYLLRMSLAPVLESLILLDRLMYLKELGYDQSYVVPVFNAVISPRHFAIIALKPETDSIEDYAF